MHPKNCTHKTNHIRINRPDLSSIFSLITHARSNNQHILYGIPPPPPCVAEKGILTREKLTHEKSAALSTRSPPPLDLLPPHLRSLTAARTLPPHTLLIPPPFRCSSFLRDSLPPPSWTCRPAPSSTCRLGDLDRGQHKSGRVFTTVAAASKTRHQ